MRYSFSRRQWLSTVAATTTTRLLHPQVADAGEIPSFPVAVAKCSGYGNELLPALSSIFDLLGGLRSLVQGKVVAIKLNMVGPPSAHVGDAPPELAQWVHPAVVEAVIRLLDQSGARRIRLLECCNDSLESLEEFMRDAGWNPEGLLKSASSLEFENTNGLGSGTAYSRITCPNGGYIFPGYDVNHSYTDCDVFVSLAKMKEHQWFGVTLSMKNCYGMTPLTIYGDEAGLDHPGASMGSTRVSVLHSGTRAPSKSAPQENDPSSPRDGGYRVPRIVADIASARPIHLAIIDGVETMAGGEGPWVPNARRVSPGVLVAGLNAMATDVVAMALMGFDPMADRGSAPFEDCDSFLRFAEERGLGTRDLSRIRVLGTPIDQARFFFREFGVQPEGIVNAASYVKGAPVAPGSIAAVFGNFLVKSLSTAPEFPLPTTLAGVSGQLAGGALVPLFFASERQSNIQVPWEVAGRLSISLRAVINRQTSDPQTVKIAPFAPGIFTANAAGTGQAAAIDRENRLVDGSNPAGAGEAIQIYCTGLGAVTNQPPTGSPAPFEPLARTTTVPTVTIGGAPAEVLFSGLAPANVGLYQVNALVPPAAARGAAVPVSISIGGVASNTATVALR